MNDRNGRHGRGLDVRQVGGREGASVGFGEDESVFRGPEGHGCWEEEAQEREMCGCELGGQRFASRRIRVAACSESTKGKANEDRVVLVGRSALVMDGIYGSGQCESLAVTKAAAELWRGQPMWQQAPEQGLCALAKTLRVRRRSSSGVAPGAAACAVSWDADGAVELASLGDVVPFLVEPAGAAALLEPRRAADGRLDAYLGRDGAIEQAILTSSVRLTSSPSCVVIATDGVWEHVPATCMREAWRAVDFDIDAFARELVRRARVFGSEDDATAVVLG